MDSILENGFSNKSSVCCCFQIGRHKADKWPLYFCSLAGAPAVPSPFLPWSSWPVRPLPLVHIARSCIFVFPTSGRWALRPWVAFRLTLTPPMAALGGPAHGCRPPLTFTLTFLCGPGRRVSGNCRKLGCFSYYVTVFSCIRGIWYLHIFGDYRYIWIYF